MNRPLALAVDATAGRNSRQEHAVVTGWNISSGENACIGLDWALGLYRRDLNLKHERGDIGTCRGNPDGDGPRTGGDTRRVLGAPGGIQECPGAE